MRIAWDNKADLATVTAESQISTLPASNVQDSRLSRQWRTIAGVKGSRLLIDLGSAVPANLLGLFGTNLTASGTIRARASVYDASGSAGDAIDTGIMSCGVQSPFTGVYKAVKASILTLDAEKTPTFYADYSKGHIYPLISGAAPTYSRATVATIKDFEGIHKIVKSGEARFKGLRRVENLVTTKSEDFSNAAWTKTNITVASSNGQYLAATAGNGTCLQSLALAAPQDYTLRVRLRRKTGSGNVQLTIDGSTYTTVTLTTDERVYSISQSNVTNPNFGIRIVTSGNEVYASRIQLEATTWQANTNPSEYVSVGVISASPFHGACVDGVKYFPTYNGNTVASNVVTEVTGAVISESLTEGFLNEGARTNSIPNNTMTGAAAGTPGTRPTGWTAWAISGLTQEIVAVGRTAGLNYIDVRLSGTSAGVQAILWFAATTGIATAQNDVWTNSFWISLVGGSLSNITGWDSLLAERDGGGTLLTSTSVAISAPTSTLTRAVATHTVGDASAVNAHPGMRFTFSNGVAIDVTIRIASPQLELAPMSSSLIHTISAAVTRNADQLSYSTTGWVKQFEGTLVSWHRHEFGSTGATRTVVGLRTDSSNRIVNSQVNSDGSLDQMTVVNGAVTQVATNVGAVVGNTDYRTAFAYKENDFAASRNGGSVVTDTSGTLPSVTTLQIGNASSGSQPLHGTVRRVAYYNERLPNTTLQAEPVALDYAVSARYWLFDIQDSALSDNLHIGRLFLGPSWECELAQDYGWRVGYRDVSDIIETDGGQEYINERPRRKYVEFQLTALTHSEAMNNALVIARDNGLVHDIVAISDIDGDYLNEKSIYGRASIMDAVEQRYFDRWATKISILESL